MNVCGHQSYRGQTDQTFPQWHPNICQFSLVDWYSSKQATFETGVIGTEFVAMNMGVDTLRGLRYKLRMMGVAIDSATHSCGNIITVIKNTSKLESILNKKSSAVCYLALREKVAMDKTLKLHLPGIEHPIS
ncbi:hypothetical protein ACHAXS_005661 [Conticribra weissflogii]